MALKGIEHYKASHHYYYKGPPFDIKHQLMLSDLILIVKISLKWEISISFIFCYFCRYIPKVKLENLVKIGANYENYLCLPYALLFDPFFCQKILKKLDFQFCFLFNTFIKNAKNHSKKFQKHKSDLYV